MSTSRKSSRTANEIVIDIPGVKPASRMADLNVEQFVALMQTVLIQTAKRKSDPEQVAAQIRELVKASSANQKSAMSESVRNAQLAILNKLPDLMREAQEIRRSSR
jgi:hypothetical protein